MLDDVADPVDAEEQVALRVFAQRRVERVGAGRGQDAREVPGRQRVNTYVRQ